MANPATRRETLHLPDRQDRRGGAPAELGSTERIATIVGGSLLVHWGLRRGGLTGLFGTLAGGAIAWMGVNGRTAGSPDVDEGTDRYARLRGFRSVAAETRTVTVARPAEELYRFWRDFSNLSKVMEHVERIEVKDDRRSHWVVNAPAGQTVEWDAIVTDDQPNRRIAWESAPGADIRNFGWVEFRPIQGGRTEVKAMIVYEPPGGEIGRMVAKLFGEEPGVQLAEDLARFRDTLEKGGAGPAAAKPRPM
ncbi:SRPBCC family protein [Chthonobacter albigriseus]|uniref:SRPBCC family protein n=1 Tax=Chthonobacter albigriseus TaxID=1683161 RepID=UPI0015EE9430|nr:SRPBCC family protein [Chthonobacter albigriseus]